MSPAAPAFEVGKSIPPRLNFHGRQPWLVLQLRFVIQLPSMRDHFTFGRGSTLFLPMTTTSLGAK